MAESFEDTVVAQIGRGNFRCTALVHFDFLTKPMRMWHGFGPLRSMGYEWAGDAGLGSMSAIGVGTAGVAEEIRLRIAASDSTLLLADEDAANAESIGRDVKIWLQWFDDRDTKEWALLGTPRLYFWGIMGAPELVSEEADNSGTRRQYVEIVATNTLALIARPPLSYFSPGDVRARSTDGTDQIADRMGEFINGTVAWPRF